MNKLILIALTAVFASQPVMASVKEDMSKLASESQCTSGPIGFWWQMYLSSSSSCLVMYTAIEIKKYVDVVGSENPQAVEFAAQLTTVAALEDSSSKNELVATQYGRVSKAIEVEQGIQAAAKEREEIAANEKAEEDARKAADAAAAEKQTKKSQLEAQITSIEAKITTLKSVNKWMDGRIEGRQDQIKNLKATAKQLDAQVTKLVNLRAEQADSIKDMSQAIQDLANNADTLGTEMSELEAEVKAGVQAYEESCYVKDGDVRDMVGDGKTGVDACTQAVTLLETNIGKLNGIISGIEAKIAKLEADLAEESSAAGVIDENTLPEVAEQIQETVEAATKDIRANITLQQKNLDGYKNTVASLTAALDALKKDKELYESDAAAYLADEEARIAEHKARIEAINAQIDAEAAVRAELLAQIENDSVVVTEAMVNDVKNQLTAVQNSIAALEQVNTDSASDIAYNKETIKKYEAEIKALKKEIKAL